MPSNPSAITTSIAALIAFKEGMDTPAFGVALTLAYIVMMDANGLRQTIGKHAKTINLLNNDQHQIPSLRERVGHQKIEILARAIVGILVGYSCSLL